VIGRATQGVRLIEMEDGDQVVAIAKLIERDEEPVNGSPSAAGDPMASTPEVPEPPAEDETPSD
jgi:hypothetical protein